MNGTFPEKATPYLAAFLLFLMPLSYLNAAFDIFGAPKIFLLRLTAAGLLGLAALHRFQGRSINPIKNPIVLAASIFLLTQILATLFSINPLISVIGLRRRYLGLSTIMAEYILFIGVSLTVWSKKNVITMFRAITASAAFVAAIGIIQALGSSFPYDLKEQFGSAAYSTLGNPNFTGIFLAMTIPLCLVLIADEDKLNYRMIYLSALLIQIAGLILTNSSGALIGAAAAILFFNIIVKPRLKLTATQKIAAAAAAAAILIGGVTMLAAKESTSARSRLRAWNAAMKLIAARPLIGVGPDAMRLAMPKFLDSDRLLNQEIYEDGHNLFLTVSGTSGLLGLTAFTALLFAAATSLRRLMNVEPRRTTAAGLAAAGAGYLLAEMFNPDDLVPLTLFWFLLGLSAALSFTDERRAKNGKTWLFFAVPAAVGILFFATLAYRNLTAEIYLLGAERQRSFTPVTREYQKVAAAFPYYDWYYTRLSGRLLPLIEQGDQKAFDVAVRAAKKALILNDRESSNHLILGDIYMRRGVAAKKTKFYFLAIDEYKTAVRQNRFNLEAVRGLALTYNQLGDSQAAAYWANRFVELTTIPLDPTLQGLREN